MSSPSYQQLVQEQIPSSNGGSAPEGPMNHAVYDDSSVPEGGGTSLRDIDPRLGEEVLRSAPVEPQHYEVPRPRTAPVQPSHTVPHAPIIPKVFEFTSTDSHRAAFLVLVLYLLVSSSFVSQKMAALVPELFENPRGVISTIGRGLLLAGIFYMIRTYMTV